MPRIPRTEPDNPLQELAVVRRQKADLEAALAEFQQVKDRLAHLASFPEQNPNLVVEANIHGQLTYLNPVAERRFPDLWEQGFDHPVLKGAPAIVAALNKGNREYVEREIDLGDSVFEQKICFTRQGELTGIRVFAHDITARRRAEQAIHELAKQVVSAQEAERRRVSRELHDEAGQALTALKISLELLISQPPNGIEELNQNLVEAVQLIDTTREHIRWLARGLRPPALDTVGLNLTLQEFCREFSDRTRIAITYQGADLEDLPEEVNICLYRVLQEALTNVAKHAGAHQVTVRLSSMDHGIRLVVQDDGRGFEPVGARPDIPHPKRIGLLGLQERVELLHGALEIRSRPDDGTHLSVTLPAEINA